ncbi:MAG: hypothetical protein RSC73_02595, partial [Ruthenibacterium sp.]
MRVFVGQGLCPCRDAKAQSGCNRARTPCMVSLQGVPQIKRNPIVFVGQGLCPCRVAKVQSGCN